MTRGEAASGVTVFTNAVEGSTILANRWNAHRIRRGIHIEWQSDEYERPWGKAAMKHVARAPIKNLLIPWSSIEKVTYRGKFFGPGVLRITARSLTAVEELPGAAGNTWWVQVAKPERRNAREFALASESAISSGRSALLPGHR